jgi:hypothetical protein
MSIWQGPNTVGDFIDLLTAFPRDWPVQVSTPAGGGIAIEHREIKGEPLVAIFGKNGGRFGENPLTDEEYLKKSQDFLHGLRSGQHYTSVHGDHRLFWPGDSQATCYGQHYDRRIIERMARDGLITTESVDFERVARLDR